MKYEALDVNPGPRQTILLQAGGAQFGPNSAVKQNALALTKLNQLSSSLMA